MVTVRRDVFQGIADPTRREILSLLAREPMNLNRLAENFKVSRPAISQHIKILNECGLLIIKKQGRERYCEPRLDKLDEVSKWIEPLKKIWGKRFSQLEMVLKNLKNKSK